MKTVTISYDNVGRVTKSISKIFKSHKFFLSSEDHDESKTNWTMQFFNDVIDIFVDLSVSEDNITVLEMSHTVVVDNNSFSTMLFFDAIKRANEHSISISEPVGITSEFPIINLSYVLFAVDKLDLHSLNLALTNFSNCVYSVLDLFKSTDKPASMVFYDMSMFEDDNSTKYSVENIAYACYNKFGGIWEEYIDHVANNHATHEPSLMTAIKACQKFELNNDCEILRVPFDINKEITAAKEEMEIATKLSEVN